MEIGCGHVDLGRVQDQFLGGAIDLGVLASESEEGCFCAESTQVSAAVPHSVVGEFRQKRVLEFRVPALCVDGENAVTVLR